jgi:hypothetical protein
MGRKAEKDDEMLALVFNVFMLGTKTKLLLKWLYAFGPP